jgi:hypothetical protein
MVRINLLKGSKRKKRPPQGPALGIIFRVAGVCGLAVLLFAGGFWLIRSGLLRPHPKVVVQQPVKEVTKPIENANVVEDVVHEIHESRDVQEKEGVLHLTYNELSIAEKINYELLFAKNVIDLLARTDPSAIGLKTLESRQFQSIYGAGVSPSQSSITDFFNALRDNEKAELLPKPHTNIAKRGTQYHFVFTLQKDFGLDLKSPSVNLGLGQLPARRDLDAAVRKFMQVAAEHSITTIQPPQQISAETLEQFRRFRFQFKGAASYQNFTLFLQALQNAAVPCAFESFRLMAQAHNTVDIDAQLLFTTMN